MAELGEYMSIYPPDVVVVAQTGSPIGGNGPNTTHSSPEHVCSPLSTAPNSPGQVTDDDYDDDEEEEEEDEAYARRRSADIKNLLVSPPKSNANLPSLEIPSLRAAHSTSSSGVTPTEIPFDEQPPQLQKRKLSATATFFEADDLPTRLPVVSPLSHNERDPKGFEVTNSNNKLYEDLSPHSQIRNVPRCLEEKKEPEQLLNEDHPSLLPKVENPSYLTSKAWAIHRKRTSPPRVFDDNNRRLARACSEDESLPMDERQQPRKVAADKIVTQSPMKALQTAEREVHEMERRVQEMIQKRKDREALERQKEQEELAAAQEAPTGDCNSDGSGYRSVEGEPPSLSPRSHQQYQPTGLVTTPDVDDIIFPPEDIDATPHYGGDESAFHSSMDSGSYYYDGSAMGSSREHSYQQLSPTRDLSRDYDALLDDHKPFDNNKASPLSFTGISAAKSFEEFTSLKTQQQQSAASAFPDISAVRSFEDFTTQFDRHAQSGSFAAAVSALQQVGEGVNSFLLRGSSSARKQQELNNDAKVSTNPHASGAESPSSDVTPAAGNLSPRGSFSPAVRLNKPNDLKPLDIGYKPSGNLARARSLILDRQQRSMSPLPQVSSAQASTSSEDGTNTSEFRQWGNDLIYNKPQTLSSIRSTGFETGNVDQKYDTRSDAKPDPSLFSLNMFGTCTEGSTDRGEKRGVEEMEDLSGPPALMRVASPPKEQSWSSKLDEQAEKNFASKPCPIDDWPSISEMMVGYESAITESFKNLSMSMTAEDDCGTGEGLLQNPAAAFGDIAGCLQMQVLSDDEPAVMRTENYGRVASLQYDDYDYHDTHDETEEFDAHHEDDINYDQIENEREKFARTLSERLLNLGALSPNASGDSADDPSPEKRSYSSGKRGNSDPYTLRESPQPRHSSDEGLYTANLPKNGYLPSSEQSEQASPSSEGGNFDNARYKITGGPEALRRALSLPALMGKGTQNTNQAAQQDPKPVLVESIDTEVGIAKGDVMLSLLCDNSFQTKDQDSWSWRVKEAIWRGRGMRKQLLGFGSKASDGGDEKETKTSLPVDVDDVRVVGGIANVSTIQGKALAHLERDEFEQALELYEDIIFNYYSFFEEVLAKRDELASQDLTAELSNFKPYIGASLHNLGIIHLLKGDYEDAFSFLTRAVENRRACLGEGHADCVTSLVRVAICRFAMDNFADAHTNLELALALAGTKAKTAKDYCQLGEILNNLGCLSYMCGQPTKAMRLFRESLDVQLAVLNSSMYGGTDYSTHSATLNTSITRGNIGFLALVLKDVPNGIHALESALREQRLLLNGAHVTLISTMDHLAVANLLQGRAQKAVKMLKRIFEAQKASYGPDDPRCEATRQKINTILTQKSILPKKPVQDIVFEAHGKRSAKSEKEKKNTDGAQTKAVSVHHGHNKVNSMFKAIRSLGRKHAR